MIRRLTPADAALLRSIRLRMLTESPTAFGSTAEETALRTSAEWEYILRADGNPFFVHLSDDLVNGIIGGLVPDASGTAHLVSMWVDSKGRGKGVSDELVRYILDWAASAGAARIVLDLTEGNLFAENLYARHGFHRTGNSEIRERDGMIEIEMELPLTGG